MDCYLLGYGNSLPIKLKKQAVFSDRKFFTYVPAPPHIASFHCLLSMFRNKIYHNMLFSGIIDNHVSLVNSNKGAHSDTC